MEIARQSEQYGLEPTHIKQADLSPEEIKDLLAGPSVQSGLLHH